MSTDVLTQVRVQQVSGYPKLAWMENMQFCLPHSVLEQSGLIEGLDTEGNLLVPTGRLNIAQKESNALRLRAAFTNQKPTSSRFPISYQKIPPRLRSWVASIIGKWQRHKVNRWAVFPQWPLDLSVDCLTDLIGSPISPFKEGSTPVVLTHDLDSAEGLKNLVQWFLDIEESVGARSSNYIVPCNWPIDHDLLQQVKDRGNEVGIHGYDHSNRTPFCDSAKCCERLEAAQKLIERYNIIGYRAPSLLRTRGLLKNLANFYHYDSSIPTSGGLFPIPNNGCASARPFFIEGIFELPLSMPRDGSLRFLGYSPDEIFNLWVHCAEDISHSGGVVVLLTHCETRFSGNRPMLKVYRQFLEFIASSSQFTWSTPKKVLDVAEQSYRRDK
jgi:peptidoglycan/xylan/chitin deacetylase (PgdA/CDA1 family)